MIMSVATLRARICKANTDILSPQSYLPHRLHNIDATRDTQNMNECLQRSQLYHPDCTSCTGESVGLTSDIKAREATTPVLRGRCRQGACQR